VSCIEKLFNLYGNSPTRVGRAVGVSKQLASQWKRRGLIPPSMAAVVQAATGGQIPEIHIVREHQVHVQMRRTKRRTEHAARA
jgi:hypothetical protein